ncbi:efflux RND transporter periplasmic adaptor subunit [Sinanaerobacter sp. ZZT-01]|uniref:efflux RND transporter periplasmic adaptor subunit n=1 Tax=Sinanaerobacter sp. ZZT-01 TaxID=3111540 RepID=UPI002D78B428|nr:efflux RND transporter periplasmic adaptor subunit [Sinanaerobacter sp. ZZT-01]WRR93508.1 efflux RND transporter periplasmic adaptor subunit [Sinanaerobacter sp. ZZT-01]
MNKKTKVIIGGFVIVVVAALLLTRFISKDESYAEISPPEVTVASPQIGTIELTSSLIGTVEPAEFVSVSPEIAGEVSEVMIQAGDRISAGQTICRIDNTQVDSTQISMESAEVSLEDAKKNFARIEVLYAEGGISEQSYEDAKSGLKRAQLQYDSAKLSYSNQAKYSVVTSPISGIVESCDVERYDVVSPQTVLCVVAGGEEKVISFNVTERVLEKLDVGSQVKIEKNGTDYTGTITETSSMVDASTGLFKVKASIKSGTALASGTSAKLFVLSDKVENVLTIPVDAVYYDDGKPFVYTYKDKMAHKVFVEVGICDESNIEVVSGLNSKDSIIVSWSSELYDEAAVILDKEASDTPMPETNEKE